MKLRKGHYVPEGDKRGIMFIDDVSMPKIEEPGINATQPAIELLRQWMDYQGWFEIKSEEKDFRKISKFSMAGAMGPPGAGKPTVTGRFIRHFNSLYIEPYSNASLNTIFNNVMDWNFMQHEKPAYGTPIRGLKEKIVLATIATYQELAIKFRPTPAKSHYTYNLRDVSKVFQGISKSNPKAVGTEDDFVKLWAHECIRTFHDRLISDEDR